MPQPDDAESEAGSEESRPLTPEELDEKSLPLRTALHQDPALVSPLDRLLEMYRQAGRLDELVGMYRDHVAAYPDDSHGAAVLVRLLAGTRDVDALRVATSAARQFPEDSLLAYLRHEVLDALHEPGALEQLDAAIELETLPARKRAWIERLLPLALAEDRLDLAEKHLRGLAEAAGDSAELRLEAAREMIALRFHAPALELLQETSALRMAPETMVEVELAAAAAEVGIDRSAAAAARLDKLLGKLTADYYRRPEIVRRRIALVVDERQREAMLAAARQRAEARPRDEAAALELAQLLVGFEFRREALETLLAAGERLPASERIETETLALFDRLRDERGREEYLAGRIERQPRRPDLKLARVKSLFLLGRRAAAIEQFDALLDLLPAAERVDQLLALARYLRSSSQGSDAAEMFRRAVELAPSRADVRRELAETYLASGDRTRARALFAEGLPDAAETEVVLDAVQFMIEQEMFVEARSVLRARLEKQPKDLELRLLLLSVEGRLGSEAEGIAAVAEARALADTPARYGRWLEAAAAFYDAFDAALAFLEEEQQRLDEELPEWNAARLERWSALAEVAARNGRKEEVALALQGYLAEELPPAVRVELARRLIAVLEKDPAQAAAIDEQLQDLAEADPQRALEYRVRRALLHAAAERLDLGLPLLADLDVTELDDVGLLNGLLRYYGQQLGGATALAIGERLVELEPANRGHWERLLESLAAAGDEGRLRGVLRQLAAGVADLPLADDSRDALRRHLVDSYWRSIAALLADGDAASAEEALVALDSVERAAGPRDGWQWIKWTRAYLLNRLERIEARDAAIAELEQALAQEREGRATADAPTPDDAALDGEEDPDAEYAQDDGEEADAAEGLPFTGIVFPDGARVAWDQAVRLLTAPVQSPRAERASARQGPLPAFRVAWAYDAPLGSDVYAVVPLDDARVLLCDTSGGVVCVDATTGKALWNEVGLLEVPSSTATISQQQAYVRLWSSAGYGALPGSYPSAPQSQFVQQGQMSFSGRTYLSSMPYGGSYQPQQVSAPAPPPRPIADGAGRVLYGAGNQVTCLRGDDGRVVWRADVAAGGGSSSSVPLSVFLQDDLVLAWSPAANAAAAFDRSTGKLRWETQLAGESQASLGWHNCGASLSDGRLLVYGASTAVLDAASGEVVWSFDPRLVRSFPLRLEAPRDADAVSVRPGSQRPGRYVPGATGYAPAGGGYTPPPTPTQYVDHLRRNGAAPPLPAGAPASRTALASPAAAWAANFTGSRVGVLAGDYLLLLDDAGLCVLSLELPLVARYAAVPGTFVGMAGNSACLLSAEALHTVDLEAGVVNWHPLTEITGGDTAARVQVALDGNLAYVASPRGVLGINARSGQKAFVAEWPAILTEAAYDPAFADPASSAGMAAHPVQYLRPGPAEYDAATGVATPLPVLASVRGGVLYVRLGAGRLVALVEAAGDAR